MRIDKAKKVLLLKSKWAKYHPNYRILNGDRPLDEYKNIGKLKARY